MRATGRHGRDLAAFLALSLGAAVAGTAWGSRGGLPLDAAALALALAGMLCLQAGAMVLKRVARGERVHALWGGALLLAANGFSAALAPAKGDVIIGFGLVGAILAAGYALAPERLAARGFSEACAALGFAASTSAFAWVQGGEASPLDIIAGAALGCWVAAIVICAEGRDDMAEKAPSIYLALQAAAAAMQLALGWLSEMPPWGSVPPLLAMLAALAAAPLMGGGSGRRRAAIQVSLGIFLAGASWLTVAALV